MVIKNMDRKDGQGTTVAFSIRGSKMTFTIWARNCILSSTSFLNSSIHSSNINK